MQISETRPIQENDSFQGDMGEVKSPTNYEKGTVSPKSSSRTRVALLRLALCYSVVPLCSAHKPKQYKDRKESRGVVTSS